MSRRSTSVRELPEESLMLTGDENIVDVDFSVLWRVKPNHVGDYLFNVQNPEGTVKAVAESAMRAGDRALERPAGCSPAAAAQETAGRAERRGNVGQELMQKTLDSYGAGILVQNVQLAEGQSAGRGHRFVP